MVKYHTHIIFTTYILNKEECYPFFKVKRVSAIFAITSIAHKKIDCLGCYSKKKGFCNDPGQVVTVNDLNSRYNEIENATTFHLVNLGEKQE